MTRDTTMDTSAGDKEPDLKRDTAVRYRAVQALLMRAGCDTGCFPHSGE